MSRGLGIGEQMIPGDLRDDLGACRLGEPLDGLLLALASSGIEHYPEEPGSAGLEVHHSLHDVVGGVEGHELPGCHQDDGVGVLAPKRNGESSADHVPEDVVDPDVHVEVVRPQLPEGVEGGENAATGAAYPGLGASGLRA